MKFQQIGEVGNFMSSSFVPFTSISFFFKKNAQNKMKLGKAAACFSAIFFVLHFAFRKKKTNNTRQARRSDFYFSRGSAV
jgi:riboflavin transporter FmnP